MNPAALSRSSSVSSRFSRTLKSAICASAIAALAAAFTSTTQAGLIISPTSYDTGGANAANLGGVPNSFPFDAGGGGFNTMRYQQVFDASQFTASFAGFRQNISQILFRPDAIGVGSAFSPSTLSDVQITLSTTTNSSSSLDTTFANNVGLDAVQVFSGPLTLSSGATDSGNGTPAFDIAIPLTTPFLYDPSQGNLLMDIKNIGGGPSLNSLGFDAVSASPGIGASVASAASPTGVDDSTGNPGGFLITQFQITPEGSPIPPPVPEPSQWGAAFAIGLLAVGVVRRRRVQAA